MKRSFQRATSNAVRMIIKRTLAFAIASFISDIANHGVVQVITGPNSHRRYAVLTGNVNIFLNLLFVILSFAPYREMLTSPCRSYE